MSHSLKQTFSAKIDGAAPPFISNPVSGTLTVDEMVPFSIEKADDGDDVTFTQLDVETPFSKITGYFLTSDRAIKVRRENQSDAHEPVSAGGWIAGHDVALEDSTFMFALNNNSGGTAVVKGFIAGT